MTRNQLAEILSQMNNIAIGPPPWSDEVLTKAYFRNSTKTRELIRAHPVYLFHRDLEDLARGVELLHDAIDSLKTACHSFRTDAVTDEFWLRTNQSGFERLVRVIRLALFAAVCAVQSLVDTCRATNQHVTIADYKDRVKASFSTWEISRFIHGLRQYISHRRALEAHWEVHMPFEAPREIRFLLRREDLLAYNEWAAEAKEYINKNSKGVDPGKLFDKYRTRVDDFHEWFHQAFMRAAQPALSEYRHYIALLDRLGNRSHWNLLVDIGIQQRLDPYTHLATHLTPEELREIAELRSVRSSRWTGLFRRLPFGRTPMLV